MLLVSLASLATFVFSPPLAVQGLRRHSQRYRSETAAGTCYGQFSEVVNNEGNALATMRNVGSDRTCKDACDANGRCSSFAYCPQWDSCFLKDAVLSGDEPTAPNSECRTYYRVACPTPSPAPGPSPGPSPTPAPPSSSYPVGMPIYMQSHRFRNLKDSAGQLQLTGNAAGWEEWVLSDVGNGQVTIRSHRGEYLQDNYGRVKLSSSAQLSEQWTIISAGAGKVAIRSHRGEYLQDSYGQVKMSDNLAEWEAWSISEEPMPLPDDAFTLVVIPDVQFMTVAGGGWVSQPPRLAWPEKWYSQGEWVAANKDRFNIKAVVQVGDLVETGCDDAHWRVFNTGWEMIHATGLPYSFAPGNHDCDNLYGCIPYGWNCYNRQVPYFLDRVSFPVEFRSSGRYENMITLFEAAGVEFIIVAVEWNTPSEALEWARWKLQQYSDRWAIFNAHYVPNSPGFFDLARWYPKTFMVTQGHACVGGEEWHKFHQGAGAQHFIEILVDYQCNSNGFLKHFTIDRAAGQVHAFTHNPNTDESRTGSNYEYTWSFVF